MSRDPDEGGLWEFALALYSSPGVEETVLRLQDESGADVNVLLWSCWLETRGIALTPDLLAEAQHAVRDWDREVVSSLRQLRRRVKPAQGGNNKRRDLYAALKQAELLAEKESLALLSGLTLPRPMGRPPPGRNVETCLALLGIRSEVPALKRAMEKCLPEA